MALRYNGSNQVKLMKQHAEDRVFRYGIGVVAVAIVIFVWNVFPALSSRFPFLLATIPVLLAAWYGGLGPGIVASVLSAVAVYYFWMDPRHIYGANPTDIAAVIIYLLIAVFVSYLTTARRKAEMAVSDADGRLRFALNAGNMGAWDWNLLTNELKWIGDLERMHGLRPGEFGGTMEAFVNLIYSEDRPKVNEDIQVALQSFGQFSTEFRVQWPDGSIHWVGGMGKALPGRDGKPARMIGIGLDLTESKMQQEKMRFLAEASTLLAASLDPETILRNISEMIIPELADWCRTTLLQEDGNLKTIGLCHKDPEKQVMLERLLELYPPERDDPDGPHQILKTNQSLLIKELSLEMFQKVAKNPEHLQMMLSMGAKSYICVPLRTRGRILGTIGFTSATPSWVYTESDLAFAEELAGRVALAVDNARLYQESKRAQEVLFLQLRENKVLLKEMNHRVKNNLQVISSLLRLQSRYAEPSAREFLLESQNRIQTMALIHEKLYGSENLTRINLQSYLKDLTEGMFDSYAVNRNKISLELKCEGEYLELDKAIPCGLLINEILTNSLKHAFPEDRSGHIWVRFRGDNGRFHLELGDDGIGIPEGLDVKQGKTLGLRLIRSLVTQLHGNLNLESSRGTKFTIDFK